MSRYLDSILRTFLSEQELQIVDGNVFIQNRYFLDAFHKFTSDTINIIRLSKETPIELVRLAHEGIVDYIIRPTNEDFLVNSYGAHTLDELNEDYLGIYASERVLNHEKVIDNEFLLSNHKNILDKGYWLIITPSDMFDVNINRDRIHGDEVTKSLKYGMIHDRCALQGRYSGRTLRKMDAKQREDYFKRLCAHETAHLVFNMEDSTSTDHFRYFGKLQHHCLSTSDFSDSAFFCDDCRTAFRVYRKANSIKNALRIN